MATESFRYSKHVGRFLRRLFSRFEEEDICYCVLHSYESLPDHAPSDVDMAIDSAGLRKIEPIIIDVVKSLNFNIIQKLYYDIPRCYYYVIFFRDEDNMPGFIQLDFMNDDPGIGRYCMTTKVLLEGRKKIGDFYIPSAASRACYLIFKKVIKGKLTHQNLEALQAALKDDPAACQNSMRSFLGSKNAKKIAQLINDGKLRDQEAILAKLRLYIKLRYIFLKPQYFGLRIFWQAKRIFERIFNPSGIIVVLLGPDGSGKSSVADQIAGRLRQGFRKINRIHWRPGLLPPLKQLLFKNNDTESISNSPHRLPSDSKSKSLIRFLYYSADFIIGYVPVLLWPKIRTSLVIVERYYYDFLIDKKRYRLQLPFNLEKLILPLIPKPDIVVTFCGPADLIYSRKQEIDKNEIDRQVKAQHCLSKNFTNIHETRVDQPFKTELAEVEGFIISNLQSRLVQRLRIS